MRSFSNLSSSSSVASLLTYCINLPRRGTLITVRGNQLATPFISIDSVLYEPVTLSPVGGKLSPKPQLGELTVLFPPHHLLAQQHQAQPPRRSPESRSPKVLLRSTTLGHWYLLYVGMGSVAMPVGYKVNRHTNRITVAGDAPSHFFTYYSSTSRIRELKVDN